MTEKMIFNPSGLITDINNQESIEAWGHDAGEFTVEDIENVLAEIEAEDTPSDKS